ncbi:MAG: permease prefix domain 1-containing protein, partial [Verrucomicrobiota bacterium]
MSTPSFSNELSGIPADIAAELEDHLLECYEAGIRSGMSSEEARQSSLRSLGAPAEIARDCLKASDPRDPRRAPLSIQQRVA